MEGSLNHIWHGTYYTMVLTLLLIEAQMFLWAIHLFPWLLLTVSLWRFLSVQCLSNDNVCYLCWDTIMCILSAHLHVIMLPRIPSWIHWHFLLCNYTAEHGKGSFGLPMYFSAVLMTGQDTYTSNWNILWALCKMRNCTKVKQWSNQRDTSLSS